MAEVFLSYSRTDRPIAQAIAVELQRLGVDVWWDHELLGGDNFRARITEVLSRATAVVVLWSRRSVDSEWVIAEAALAKDKRTIVPVNIDGVVPPLDFKQIHTIDFKEWVPGDQLSAAILKPLAERLGRNIAYGSEPVLPGRLERFSRRTIQAWYMDFEGMLFYLIAQGFACFLCALPFAFLAQSPTIFGGDARAWPVWIPFAFSLMLGVILAPLVMQPLLASLRLPKALPLLIIASLLGLASYAIGSALLAQMQSAILLLIGPSTLIMLLSAALGARSLSR